MSFANWFEAFMHQIVGKEEKSRRRTIWKWLGPPLAILVVLTFVAWCGFKLDSKLTERLPAWLQSIPLVIPYSPWILIPAMVFFTWHAALAFEKIRTPVIWLKEIGVDDNYLMLELRIANRGPGEVFAHVHAQELRDRKGRVIQRIDPPGIETHWRGLKAGERMKLYGDRLGSSGVVCVQNWADTPALHFTAPPGPEDPAGTYRVAPIFPSLPFGQQKPFMLTLRIEFYEVVHKDLQSEVEGKCVKSKLVPLWITPNAKRKRYKIRPVGLFSRSCFLPAIKPSAGEPPQ